MRNTTTQLHSSHKHAKLMMQKAGAANTHTHIETCVAVRNKCAKISKTTFKSTPRWIVYVFPKLNILGQFNTVGLGRWTSGYQLVLNSLPYVNFASTVLINLHGIRKPAAETQSMTTSLNLKTCSNRTIHTQCDLRPMRAQDEQSLAIQPRTSLFLRPLFSHHLPHVRQ